MSGWLVLDGAHVSKFEPPGDHTSQAPALAHVLAPTTPSLVSPKKLWIDLVAAAVLAPKCPSMPAGQVKRP